MQEFDLIRMLAERLPKGRADTRLGIGDDGAVIAPPAGHELVVTTDTLIAGRHFPDDADAADVGFKAVAVNLSDVAAMGAQPAWITVALSAPELERAWCGAFVGGMLQAVGEAPVDIVGGDTTCGPLSVTVTAFGPVPEGMAVRRDGARPGDCVCVTGTLGDAALGLRLWQGGRPRSPDAHAAWLHQRLHRPTWRRGAVMQGRVHAAIDLSDGFAADLGHVLEASGCGARIEAGELPSSAPFDALCPAADRYALQLTGGDDYELCITLAEQEIESLAEALGCPLTRIGVIESRPGLRIVDENGRRLAPNDYRGWDHFT